MTSVLAVDGGQSGVRVCVSGRPGGATTVVELPGVTRLDDPHTAIPARVHDAVEHLRRPGISRVVVGLTTAPTDLAQCADLSAALAKVTGANEVWVADDTVTAHAAAFAGEPGIALWVGTGVACFAVTAQQGARRFDGLGFLLGDLGGAFSIGRRALAHVLRQHDISTAAGGSLAECVQERFGPLEHIPVVVHDSPTMIQDVAELAPDVLASAATDPAAAEIVAWAAQQLALTLTAATEWARGAPRIVLGGGVLTSTPTLRQALAKEFPEKHLAVTTSAAIDGALWLGHQESPGVYHDAVHEWSADE